MILIYGGVQSRAYLFIYHMLQLLSSSITPVMLDRAGRMIHHYCFKIQHYYTECQMTANVLHLPQIVLNFGPLHVHLKD